jgi:hypothetical protein
MISRFIRIVGAIVLLASLLNSSIFACGPFSLEAVFVFTVHPAYPLERFARGELGVIQPSYARSYLYVAYRYLSNSPFTPAEQKALTELWRDRLNLGAETGGDDWVKVWLAARQKVTGLPESPQINVFRNREKPNEYETYLNCRKDAFDSAINTLNERIKTYGADSEAVRSWVAGQDQVFANCSEGQHIPEALPTSADALAQDDRNYQIAAANFYATSFDEARKTFKAIAKDGSSPWKSAAPYLVARTLVRKASLGAEESRNDSFNQAEIQLKSILSNKGLANTHAASARLLDLVRLRLHPAERLHELAVELVSKTPNENLKQDLWDYTVLLDGALEPDNAAKISRDIVHQDEMTDWIATIQGNSNEAREHALSRWRTTHAATWLIGALSKADGKTANNADLIQSGLSVKPTSPGFGAAQFHTVRLLMETGKIAEARAHLDELLKSNRSQFDPSSLNLLISERMMAASNLSDFLNRAPRIPATVSWNEDGREIPAELSDVSQENKALIGKPFFDFDAAKVLNTQIPLSLWKEAADSQSLPIHLRRDVAQAAWIRAVLVGDNKTADDLVPALKVLVPDLTPELDDFGKTLEPGAKTFSALYTWLKNPGVEPIVDQGVGRENSLSKQDSYRDNWWCAATTVAPQDAIPPDTDELMSFTSSSIPGPYFLTDTQRAAGRKEWVALSSLGAIPNYLCKEIIQFANKNPSDPRVPEALHLAVNATRYGCTDKDTGRWSKAAFDLLHRRYGTTTWAKKTKYWFKE